ncbi:mucin-17 [Lingula anatina]|uniref:Mucin-17 n=1 Tax=Lingula anatina TaxID=7574 RepID=A0A1S3J144_LINAN|nr:mucin-17 [Lingula anatina]|eukprot:XP_013404160.1 mucin-17 [Lingula anatina]
MPRAFLARNKHKRGNEEETEDEVDQKRRRPTLPTRPYSPEIPWKLAEEGLRGKKQQRRSRSSGKETMQQQTDSIADNRQASEKEISYDDKFSKKQQTKTKEKNEPNKTSRNNRPGMIAKNKKIKVTKGKKPKVSEKLESLKDSKDPEKSPHESIDQQFNETETGGSTEASEITAENDDKVTDEMSNYLHEDAVLNTKVEVHKDSDGKMITKYICTICWKEFTARYTLLRHMPVHTGERKYKCDICGKMFKQSSVLCRHKATHTSARPYVCATCNKAFSRVSTLNAHKLIHSGQKQFKCEQCGKQFHQKGNLKNHMYTHTGERPFACPLCSRSFNQRSNLTYHISQCHSKRNSIYNCQLCGEGFRTKSSLMTHEAVKHTQQTLKPDIQTLIFVPTTPATKGRIGQMTCRLDDGTMTINHQEYLSRTKKRVEKANAQAGEEAGEADMDICASSYHGEIATEILKLLNKNSSNVQPQNQQDVAETVSSAEKDTSEEDPEDVTGEIEADGEKKEGEASKSSVSSDVKVFSYKGEKFKVLASMVPPEQSVEQIKSPSRTTNQNAALLSSHESTLSPFSQTSVTTAQISQNNADDRVQKLTSVPMIKPVAFDQTGTAIVQLTVSEGDAPTYGRMLALDKNATGKGSSSGGMAFRIEPLVQEELSHIQQLLSSKPVPSSKPVTVSNIAFSSSALTSVTVPSVVTTTTSQTTVPVPSLTVTSLMQPTAAMGTLPAVTVTSTVAAHQASGGSTAQSPNKTLPCNISTSIRNETQSTHLNDGKKNESLPVIANPPGGAASLLLSMANIAAKQQEKQPSVLKELLGIMRSSGTLTSASLTQSVARTTNTVTEGANRVSKNSTNTVTSNTEDAAIVSMPNPPILNPTSSENVGFIRTAKKTDAVISAGIPSSLPISTWCDHSSSNTITAVTSNTMSRPQIATAPPKQYEITHHKLKSGGKVERILLKHGASSAGSGISAPTSAGVRIVTRGQQGSVSLAMAAQIEKFRKIAPKPKTENEMEKMASLQQKPTNQMTVAGQQLASLSQSQLTHLMNAVTPESTYHQNQPVMMPSSLPTGQAGLTSVQSNTGQTFPTGLLINTPNGPTLIPLSASQVLPLVMQSGLPPGVPLLGQGEGQIGITQQEKEQLLLSDSGSSVDNIMMTPPVSSDDSQTQSGSSNVTCYNKIKEVLNVADTTGGGSSAGQDADGVPKLDSSNINNLLHFLRLLDTDTPSVPTPDSSISSTVGGATVSSQSITINTGPSTHRSTTQQSPKKDSLLVHYLTHLPSGRIKGSNSDHQHGDPLLQGVSHVPSHVPRSTGYGTEDESSESLIPRSLISESPEDSSKSEDFQTVLEKMFSILNSQE